MLYVDNEAYSKQAQSFQSDLAQSGLGCVAYMEAVPHEQNDPAELQRIVTVMGKSTARVVIAFVHTVNMIRLMEEVGPGACWAPNSARVMILTSPVARAVLSAF